MKTEMESAAPNRTTSLWKGASEFKPSLFLLLTAGLFCIGLSQSVQAQNPAPDDFDPGATADLLTPAVEALAVQPDGKILVGGSFERLSGEWRFFIGRLNADGSLDSSFNPWVDDLVRALALQPDGKILVGGYFTTLGGQARDCLGRLNADGTVDTSFNPGVSGGYNNGSSVETLALQPDGKIIVGGDFTLIGGQPRTNLARLNPDGSLDTGFDPNAGAGPEKSLVVCLALQPDGKILVGGNFSLLNGQPRSCIGRLRADGKLDLAFDPGTSGGAGRLVYALAVQADGKILVGGDFKALGGQQRPFLGRLNADGRLDAGFNPGPNGLVGPYVCALALQADGKILVGGSFETIAGWPHLNLSRLNTDGTPDAEFDAGAEGGYVGSLAVQADGKVLVGGSFSKLAGQPRENIGRLIATDLAAQSLVSDDSTITWLRGGTSPEVWRTTFEQSSDGLTWASLGAGTRIAGGWQLTNVYLPGGAIRARGCVTGGGLGWFVETNLTPQFNNIVENGAVTVSGYTGPGGTVTIPNAVNSLTVTSIGEKAFLGFTNLTSVILPENLTNIGALAFSDCYRLAGAHFRGDAVSLNLAADVFQGATNTTVYYLPGRTGWGSTLAGRPTALWRPKMPLRDPRFGVQTNQFGFSISWASGMTVVIETCTNLAGQIWCPVQTNRMIRDAVMYSDPDWTNYPTRVYRIQSE